MNHLDNLKECIQKPIYKVVLTNNSIYDRNQIYNYIYWRLTSPINAIAFIKNFYSKLEYLKINPYIYSKFSYPINSKYEYRKISLNNFIIIYYIDETVQCVFVVHIFYAGSNFINKI